MEPLLSNALARNSEYSSPRDDEATGAFAPSGNPVNANDMQVSEANQQPEDAIASSFDWENGPLVVRGNNGVMTFANRLLGRPRPRHNTTFLASDGNICVTPLSPRPVRRAREPRTTLRGSDVPVSAKDHDDWSVDREFSDAPQRATQDLRAMCGFLRSHGFNVSANADKVMIARVGAAALGAQSRSTAPGSTRRSSQVPRTSEVHWHSMLGVSKSAGLDSFSVRYSAEAKRATGHSLCWFDTFLGKFKSPDFGGSPVKWDATQLTSEGITRTERPFVAAPRR